MNSWVADLVSKQVANIAERAAAVVAEDVEKALRDTANEPYARSLRTTAQEASLRALTAVGWFYGLELHVSLRLHAGEWFITDERGDILKINGDRKRIVEVALSMRAMGVI